MLNGLALIPGRCCVNSIGDPNFTLINIATINKRGDNKIRPIKVHIISKTLFIFNFPLPSRLLQIFIESNLLLVIGPLQINFVRVMGNVYKSKQTLLS